MLNSLRLRPILVSALVLACTREAVRGDLVTDYEALFNDHVEITIPGYSGGTTKLSNFPLLVRVSEDNPTGFAYSRVDSAGKDIRFLYSAGGADPVSVPYEVDTWNTNGVSALWVRLPSVNNNAATKLTMYWAASDPDKLPANVPSSVWTGYSGVWHMNGVADSSPNDVTATKGTKAVSYAGVIGSALGTRDSGANGPIMTVPSGSVIDAMTYGAYTVTCWLRAESLAGGPWLYASRTTATSDAFGVALISDSGVKLKIHSDASTADTSTKSFSAGEWVHLAVVHESASGRHRVYRNGIEFYYPTNDRTDKPGGGLAFGGLIGESAAGTLNGDLDDIRIYPGELSRSWCTNEYVQAVSTNYVSFGEVSSTGVPVYEDDEGGKTPGDDPSPGPASDASAADYAGTATFVPEGVEEGVVLTNFVTLVKVWEGEPSGFVPADLPFGTEDIRFFDDQGNVLDYEIDLWDVNYECHFWVKIPRLSQSTRITMCWGLREGKTLPEVDATAVWSDYAGVWHMTDAHDSTANGATGALGPSAVSTYGLAGKASGTKLTGQNGAILDIEANAAIDALADEPFTVSGWVYLNSAATAYGALFSRSSSESSAWGAQFCGGTAGDSSKLELQAGASSAQISTVISAKSWVKFDILYSSSRLALYLNGEKAGESAAARTIMNGNSGGLSVGGFVAAAGDLLGVNTLNGYVDEFRLRAGTPSEAEMTADVEQCSYDDFYTRQAAKWDESAILQNRWKSYPTASKTEWRYGEAPADFTLGEPWYGSSSISYQVRSTGEILEEMPTEGGDYRAIFTVPASGRYSSLEYTIDFRIRRYKPSHDLGEGNERVLLLNNDTSVSGGEVRAQSYSDTAGGLERPYWVHDVDTGYDYTSTSPYFNFCGGLRHTYYSADDVRLWDLIDVRYGNTYHNADQVFWETGGWEMWDEGLEAGLNYLPWNPDGGCLVDDMGLPAEGWHEYAAQAVLCNSTKASINSTLYTNGLGTIYFDCVNSHTDDATNGYYKLVLEIATNAISRTTGRPVGVPTDENIASTYDVWDEDLGEWVTVVNDPYYYADWKRVPMVVRLVSGETMTELGTNEVLNLNLTAGGSYTNFYRVYAPLNIFGKARFRIRRIAVNPNYTISKDIRSMILVDNVICSTPTDRALVEPRGIYDATKVKRETIGYEGAFKPSYPSISDSEVYARVRVKSLVTGQAMPAGSVSSIVMHYRWRYIDQQYTDWATADIEPVSLISVKPIVWPGISGDLEYWYEANQSGEFYQYADYSGTGLGLPGYSEEVAGVESRSPTYWTDGQDWFTRIRDGKSDYGTVKLYVKRGESAAVETVEMFVARDRIWRGCLLATNAVAGGIYFRFEGRNCQNDELEDYQYNTNYWYLTGTTETLPLSGSVVAGTTNDWGCVPCDGATGHLMFQLDESTRALTVVHADWQDFNGWNDAHRDYFSGSSADDVTKRGVSAAQREYLCYASGWKEDCPTNIYWIERFVPGSYAGYDFYKPFLSTSSPNGFGVGEGMWVRGAYADDAELSGMALQMAGQGRGYVQLTNPQVQPRGLEAVRFSSRIAQAVSPDDFAYFEGGVFSNDYSFVTRAAFDLGGNSNFTGNASLSLAAFYRPRTSCYEARWEQIGGDIENESGTILGPSPRGQRLALYRWDFAGQEWKSTELYAATNSGSIYSWKQAYSPKAIPAAFSITNGLMPFMFGAYNNASKNYTVLVAAVHIAGVADMSKNIAGNRADSTLKFLGDEQGWLYLVYRDTSANRLKRGTYGVLAANCEGVFVRPQLHAGLVSWSDQNTTRQLATQIWPGSKASRGEYAKFYNYASAHACVEDLAEDYWVVPNGRMCSFYELGDLGYTEYNGFNAAVVTQTVDVYTAPFGTANWTNIASRTLTGFGKPGVLQDTVFNLWTTDDSAVRIQPGGTITDVRTDVVVDNIQISQWRGQDWLGNTSTEQGQGGRTNFVYTSGWITDGALQLSPRRTQDNYPCSLRVPLCDGQGTTGAKRGIGLGSLSIWYRNAQANARLLVQIATNAVGTGTLLSRTLDPGTDSATWTTVTNWDFSALPSSGVLTCSPGLHGVSGTMRVIVDPTLRAEVKDGTDPDYFGSVEITQALFRDEPPLDKGCWWGFNIRTIGDVSDVEQRMYLPDNPYRSLNPTLDEIGRSFAINNSITEDCDPSEVGKTPNPFKTHMPFLQTPTFTSNIVGEVSFKARKYALQKGAQCAEVTLYGTTAEKIDDLKDKDWDILNVFLVSNTTFETYRFKTDGMASYRAFRFAVTGVDGVAYPGPEPISGDEPVRVLLDDVLVSEAVRARLAFRNVGAFRHDISETTYVPNVPSVDEQPLVGEAWGVQAEIFPAMLGDEIDTEVPPRVKLHYFTKKKPWGYKNWKDNAAAKSGWLTCATDTNNFYRSSATDSPETVIPMTSTANTVVQYMLEVVYTVVNPETGGRTIATNWLESADWDVPSWFSPVDYNADSKYGQGLTANFSAFTILDEIAPGWAWINEANIFGAISNLQNTDDNRQFVEIAKPAESGLENWRLELLTYKSGNTDPETALITTNVLATFGMGNVTSTKTTKHASANMTFMVVGCPNSENKTLYRTSTDDTKDETLDGIWSFQTTDGTTCKSDGTLGYYSPIGLRLVRSSGVIEHEIVCIGTNKYATSAYMRKRYDPLNLVSRLNAVDASGRFFFAGSDDGGSAKSLGVYDSRGESSNVWNRVQILTPGRINANQTINPDHPTPGGELIMIFASVDTTFGHIVQTVGSVTNSTALQTISIKSGNEGGTNITYTVDPWYELGTVKETENSKARTPVIATTGRRQYTVNVAKGAKRNVTVVASAAVDSRLRTEFGLDENNRYTPAVLHWLEKHTDAYGNEFYDWESGEIHLAKFLALSGNVVTNMTLTQMYWLDMDPTVSNMFFKAGMVRPPSPTVLWNPKYVAGEAQAETNLRMGVYMAISNGNENADTRMNGKIAWAPYVLRGLGNGELSWNYYPESASAWTSVTFKVTGFLNNGLNKEKDVLSWVPLRYFVFDENSFDAAFESEIDIGDPFTTSSLGYFYGWYDWALKYGKPDIWFSWNIDQRLVPVTAEILAPTNRLTAISTP